MAYPQVIPHILIISDRLTPRYGEPFVHYDMTVFFDESVFARQ